ncbi:hypothetical protein ACFYPZ_37815 [Streptomyces sp. NPDC005506]|uniref:hypothetical protein n=1 Tax=unclassified Streptomyces TaxID=2593676 RepID=UPI00368ECDFB
MTIADTRGDSIHDTVFVSGFCRTILPELLAQAGLSDADADGVVVDVIRRARMLAALPGEYADVLATPFLEEVSQHRPLSAPAWLRAAVVVAIRNSRLEEFHARRSRRGRRRRGHHGSRHRPARVAPGAAR